jgi:phosphoserine aminotransferase
MAQDSYNFSAGPAMLPSEVKLQAIEELGRNGRDGFSVIEISHRSDRFLGILEDTEHRLRRLLSVPDDYKILFVSGGASMQFSMIPYNFLNNGDSADFIVSGYWSEKAAKEAAKCGRANLIFDGSSDGFKTLPNPQDIVCDPKSRYLHYCSNETIHGLEFTDVPKGSIPVVCDASSNILSKPIGVDRHSMVYAGAQKNIGPSGISVVVIKDEFMKSALPNRLAYMDYRLLAETLSMPFTPNTWGIFLVGLVCEWIESQGGTVAMEERNSLKSGLIYDVIDESREFYLGHAVEDFRSRMNITFKLEREEMEVSFLKEAELNGLHGLKGHRSIGGIRASMYNAFPVEGAERLAEFMREFRLKHS